MQDIEDYLQGFCDSEYMKGYAEYIGTRTQKCTRTHSLSCYLSHTRSAHLAHNNEAHVMCVCV